MRLIKFHSILIMKANLVASFQTQLTGPSWSRVVAGNKIIIRQGTKLLRVNFQTQKIDGEVDMGVEYQRHPIAVQQSTYIEVLETELLKVDYKAMDKVEKVELPKPFPKLVAPCYTQFEGSVVIQNS